MSEIETRKPQAAVAADRAFAAADGERALLPVVSIAGLAGTVVLALVASSAAEPLLLTLLASLAMLGTFLVFGLAAGHVRIGERVRDDDLIKALANGLEDGVLVTRQDGTLVYANKSFRNLVGHTAAGELRSLDDVLSGEHLASAALFRLTRAAHRGEPWCEEIEVALPRTGGVRLLRISHRPCSVPGQERNLGPMVLWTVGDVTEERAKQASAVRSLEATLALYDGAPLGLMATDRAGIVRHANATLLGWLGREPETVSRQSLRLSQIVPAEGLELLTSAAQAHGDDNSGIDLELPGEGGHLVPMRFFVRREADGGLLMGVLNRSSGDVAGLGGESAEIRFARFFQSAPFGIATIGADGRIVSANAAFSRMVLDRASSIGLRAVDVLCRTADADAVRAVEAGLEQALRGRSGTTPMDITVGPQKEFSRRLYASPLMQGNGSREAAILYVIDATEQKALEAKFAQSSKMEAVGKLAGGIAHDFNNVLTAIIGFSDLLLQTHRPTDPAYKDIKNIQSSAYRAAGMVRQLLSFSRRQTLQAESLLLSEVLSENSSMLKTSLGEKIEFNTQTSRDLWYVKVDKTEFVRVIVNLSVNARDAMPGGGTLTIRTRNVTERESQRLSRHGMPVAEYVLVEVADTGTGMTPEVMSKIFEPFFTTKGVGKGTGLGLATVYGIVKQSGGFIYAESEPGRGTTFRVYLPRHVPDNEDEIVAQKTVRKERLADLTGHGRVLLVEDEDAVRSFAVRALKRQGYEVLEAATGLEALEVMAKNNHEVDIVVSDVIMPEMDGPTLLKELRKRNPDLKIIFVSGYPHEAFETSLDKDEQFAFLPKPFSLPQLAAKVKEQLGR
jgi:two-component system cell cycle sensor histidine kinase/response regulator CckA